MLLKSRQLSAGQAKGQIIHYRKKRKPASYSGKIVIVPDINPEEISIGIKKAKAIITEKGGITSHGAIVARELNIPCVVLPDALKIIKEEESVQIDKSGQVQVEGKIKTKSKKKRYMAKRFKTMPGGWQKHFEKSPFTTFLLSLGVKEGTALINKTLFGSNKKVELRLKGHHHMYKNNPGPEKITNKIMADPVWYSRKIKERQKVYRDLKKKIRRIIKKVEKKQLTPNGSLQELINFKPQMIGFRKYLTLTQYPIDIVDEDFYKLGKKIIPDQLLAPFIKKLVKSK